MEFDFMKNVEICELGENYWVVKANTKKFGKKAIMYEGNNFKECEDYVRKHQSLSVTDKDCKDLVWTVKYNHKGRHYYLTYTSNGKHYPSIRVKKSIAEDFIKEVASY